MNTDAEKIIAVLSPEIENKCAKIKEARKAKIMTRLFVLLCVFAVVVPTLFVLWGLSLVTIIAPIAFIAISFLILSPILINQQRGRIYEQF